MTFRSLLVIIPKVIVFSQNIADCIDAVAVCETTSVNYEVIGIGDVNDLPINESGCLGDGGAGTGIESNSIWFRFKAARNGQLGFNIIPDNPTDDWDFAVHGPDVSCNDLGNPVDWSGPGDCGISNYNSGNPNDGGQTGAGDPPSFQSDAWYTPFLDLREGEEYLLLINSFNGGNDSFTLEWTGRLIDDGLGNPLDCSIVVGDLGPDQEVCEGTIITLDGTSPNATAIGYQWFLDSGSGFAQIAGEVDPLLVIDNNQSGIYKVEVTDDIGNTDEDEVMITFYTVPISTTIPPDIQGCDEDRSGFVDFDLIADQTPEILNGLDPILNPDLTDFEVLYFDNLVDAEANTTGAIIANPYPVNTSDNPTIYARIHNINNTTCYTIVEFKLKVTDTPTPTQPSEYRLCDDAASGSDIDQKSLFLLNTKDAEMLATVTNPGDYFISYHTDLIDAQTSSTSNAIDKNADYEVTISQRIYVRIENIENSACNAVSDDSLGSTFTSFELIVDATPVVITPPLDINRCDENRVGFLDFDLITDQTPEILNGLDPSIDTTVFEVLYFDTLADADANNTTAIIANPYRVNTSDNPTIFGRIHNINNTTC